MVLMESLSGSGHKFATLKPKGVEKLEAYRFDPMGWYYQFFQKKKKINKNKVTLKNH